ncbi:MAG: MerR family transcriptional regulator [Methylocystaceae bacterium]
MEVANLHRAFSIKEVAELLEVNESSIRYWDKEYGFYLKIPRTENNERYFTDKEIRRLENIKRLRDRGLSSKAILELVNKGAREEAEAEAKGKLVPVAEVTLAEFDYFKDEFRELLIDTLDEKNLRLEDKMEQMQVEILASLDEEMVRLHAKLNSDRDVRDRDEYIRAKQENAQLRAEVAALRQEVGRHLEEEVKTRGNLFTRWFRWRRRDEEDLEEMETGYNGF